MAGSTHDAPPSGLVVHITDAVHAVGAYGATLIQVWRGPPTGGPTAEINRLTSELIQSSAVPPSSFFIVERSSPPPNDEARKNLATFSRDLVGRMSIAVVVAEGGGFRGALVRSVGVALTTVLPHSSKFKFVNDVAQGAELIAPHLAGVALGASADRLVEAAEWLRSRIG